MSSNNVVWCMLYNKSYHVFYSGCADNTPNKPDYKDKRYMKFKYRSNALLYAHDVVEHINKESYDEGFAGVEYGVAEITVVEEKTLEERIKKIEDKFITKRDYYNMDTICDQLLKVNKFVINYEARHPKPRKDGCYQFTYCNECLAYPMGLGCPNLVKGPVQLKDEVKHGKKD